MKRVDTGLGIAWMFRLGRDNKVIKRYKYDLWEMLKKKKVGSYLVNTRKRS